MIIILQDFCDFNQKNGAFKHPKGLEISSGVDTVLRRKS